MKSANKKEIQEEFTRQAHGFASDKMNFTKQEYLNYMIKHMQPSSKDDILEVAAGTCICARAIAPMSGHIICLDMTPAMLSVGREAAKEEKINNISFVLGDVAELPFLDNSFDIVFSRLAFHHFPDIEQPFSEMERVLKPDGKLIIIDMEAASEELRQKEDAIEKLRDPSHIRNRSREEFLSLYEKNGLDVHFCETQSVPMVLQNWLNHTHTPQDIQNRIISMMKEDINGGAKTGFNPYIKDDKVHFNHNWLMIEGKKRTQK